MKKKELDNLLVSYLYASFVALFSYYMYHVYVGQDLALYAYYYENLTNDIFESFLFYNRTLGSEEPIYFLITFFFKGYVSKELLMSFSNFFLAFFLSRLVLNTNVNILVWFSVVTNYYIWVLYLPAERLKFGFIFILASLHLLKMRHFFYALSVMSHVQSFIAIYLIFSFRAKSYVIGFFKKPFRAFFGLFFLVVLFGSLFLLLKSQLFLKVEAYYSKGFDISGALKVFVFMVLSFISFKKYLNKFDLISVFFPLLVLAFLLGGERIVMFAVCFFIALSLYYRKGKNLSFLIVSFYFLLKSIEFFYNTFTKGYAF
ncbi:MAG: hypothetical protein ACK4ML_06920 [Alishewanella aestuarii]